MINANASETAQTVLLVLELEQSLVPTSTCAFDLSNGTRHERQKYVGGLVINRAGEVRRIEKINVLGPFGASMLGKIVSILTSGRHISTHFLVPSRFRPQRLHATSCGVHGHSLLGQVLHCRTSIGPFDGEAWDEKF